MTTSERYSQVLSACVQDLDIVYHNSVLRRQSNDDISPTQSDNYDTRLVIKACVGEQEHEIADISLNDDSSPKDNKSSYDEPFSPTLPTKAQELERKLVKCKRLWFMPTLNRRETEKLLSNCPEIGVFIVRLSTDMAAVHTITYRRDGLKVPYHHVRMIVNPIGRYFLEGSSKTFAAIEKLICHYLQPNNDLNEPLALPKKIASAVDQELFIFNSQGEQFWTSYATSSSVNVPLPSVPKSAPPPGNFFFNHNKTYDDHEYSDLNHLTTSKTHSHSAIFSADSQAISFDEDDDDHLYSEINLSTKKQPSSKSLYNPQPPPPPPMPSEAMLKCPPEKPPLPLNMMDKKDFKTKRDAQKTSNKPSVSSVNDLTKKFEQKGDSTKPSGISFLTKKKAKSPNPQSPNKLPVPPPPPPLPPLITTNPPYMSAIESCASAEDNVYSLPHNNSDKHKPIYSMPPYSESDPAEGNYADPWDNNLLMKKLLNNSENFPDDKAAKQVDPSTLSMPQEYDQPANSKLPAISDDIYEDINSTEKTIPPMSKPSLQLSTANHLLNTSDYSSSNDIYDDVTTDEGPSCKPPISLSKPLISPKPNLPPTSSDIYEDITPDNNQTDKAPASLGSGSSNSSSIPTLSSNYKAQIIDDSEMISGPSYEPISNFSTYSPKISDDDQSSVGEEFCERVMPELSVTKMAGKVIKNYIMKSSRDSQSTFAKQLRQFIDCTLKSKEKNPHCVMRNVRQFMNGIKNFLKKQEDFTTIVNKEQKKLSPSEIFNVDGCIEATLQSLIVRHLRAHIKKLLTDSHKETDRFLVLSRSLQCAVTKSAIELGVKETINPPSQDDLQRINKCFEKMQICYSPLKKLEALLNAIKIIYSTITDSETSVTLNPSKVGADDFLPVFVYVLAQCNFLSAELEADYMEGLLDASLLAGEGGYYLTSLQSAIQIIKSLVSSVTDRKTSLSYEATQGVIKVVILDESNELAISKTFPISETTDVATLCKMIANCLNIFNPNNYALYQFTENEEKIIPEKSNIQNIKEKHQKKFNKPCALLYKRKDSYFLMSSIE